MLIARAAEGQRWMSSYNRNLSSCLAAALIFIFAAALNRSCHRQEVKMEPIGPDVQANLVVFFKTDATADQIYTFAKETIGNPTDRGYESLPGMRTTLLVSVDGHKGYAITFFPEATEAQRRYVRTRVDASPLVFKVVENVIPDEIKTLK